MREKVKTLPNGVDVGNEAKCHKRLVFELRQS